jgi:hypothetical protein
LSLWIKCFKGKTREEFRGLETVNDDQYFALHEKFLYATCTRGGEVSSKTRNNDPEYNRTHIGLFHNNLATKIFRDSHFDAYGLAVRSGMPRAAPCEPCGVVGWLDRQKNEAMVSGDVHNKFYLPLCDSVPIDLVAEFPCLGFCTNQFVVETLFGIRIKDSDLVLKMRSDGLSPLFPPRENVKIINDLLTRYDAGQTIAKEDFEKYFVNFDKSWPDAMRRKLFIGLIVDSDVLDHVSGHCWRGGLQPCFFEVLSVWLQHEPRTY